MDVASIAELIAMRAKQNPEGASIRAPGRASMAYTDLAAAIGRIASVLRENGIGSSDRVALALPNGPEIAVAFLGVTAAAACAPLNPAYKEDEFAFSFDDLGIRLLITDSGRVPAAAAAARRAGLRILELRAEPDAPAGVFELDGSAGGRATASAEPRGDDVALLLHTSGTTARPKIVPLTQANLCASAANIRRTLALAPGDSCLNVMPLFHIHGLMAALLASIDAGASVICTGGIRGADFAGWLQELGPTWYTAVPTIHQAVLEGCSPSVTAGARLRFVRSSSAALPARVLEELSERFSVPVIEAYGMTEATHQIASNPLDGVRKVGSVGRQAGPEVSILDERGERTDRAGAIGEIVIRGPTVTRGYENNAQANAAAFADGWLRTGDQGYLDEDGYVFLTGRLKELINRGGEKIAPREVEEALLRHGAVAQAVAFAVPHARLGEDVGAAVVLRPGASASASDLRSAAAERLAYFKVPRRIALVDEIPKGATGKVQRSSLARALGMLEERDSSEATSAPSSELERRLAELWSSILGGARDIGVHDDFFAIGGDSIAAVEMVVAAADVLGMEVPIADFLERPTIACLVELRERASALAVGGKEDVVALRLGGDSLPIFCTAAHDGSLWRVSRMMRHVAPGHPVFGFPAPAVPSRGALPTIQDLAEQNLAALARIQPEGPVHLVGPCFGGSVALKMAIRLERSRRPVALLVMLNTFNRAWRSTSHERSRSALRGRHAIDRVQLLATRLRAQQPNERLAYVRARARLTATRATERVDQLVFNLADRIGVPRPRRVRKVAYANRWAQARYEAGPYHGPVMMVRAVAPIAGVYPLPLMGWSHALRGDVELIDMDCEQLEFWDDDDILRDVARRIDERLARSLAASAPQAGFASSGARR